MPDDSFIRIGHCSPDAPNVDVTLDGEMAFEDVGFRTIGEYATIPAGKHDIAVMAHGESDPVLETAVDVQANTAYTALATGLAGQEDLEAMLLTDERKTIPAEKSHVRFVHCSPDAPRVTLRVADGGPTLFRNVTFRRASDYKPVDAGTYDLEVVPSGSDDVALSISGLQLDGGTAYSAIAVGQLSDGSLEAILAEDARIAIEAGD